MSDLKDYFGWQNNLKALSASGMLPERHIYALMALKEFMKAQKDQE